MNKRALIWIAVSDPNQAKPDKISLVEQERAAREWCAANECDVVGILSIPGESRSESDVLTIFEDFAQKGIFAYHDLRRMWQPPRQFDILIAYHDTRLGRSEALYTYVISNVMKSGASIYCIIGGWYQPGDYKTKMAFGMVTASSEMDRLILLTAAKRFDKAPRGLLVQGAPCWAYKVERNEKGEAVRKIPDEQHRIVIETAAQLVVEGVGWGRVEIELANRFDFRVNGEPYPRSTFYFLFHNPHFWGNEVIHVGRVNGKKKAGRNRAGTGIWCFDPSHSPPIKTQVWYDVLTPYLSGASEELGELLKTELRRRHHSIKGSTVPHRSNKFAGLLTCYYCGRNLVCAPANQGRHIYYKCVSKYQSFKANRCDIMRSIRQEVVQAWFHDELQQAIDANDPEWFMHQGAETSRSERLEHIKSQQEEKSHLMQRAQAEILRTDDEFTQQGYRQSIAEFSAELQELERQKSRLQSQVSNDAQAARAAFKRLLEYPDLDVFWTGGDNVVNQILHGLLGERSLLIQDKQVVGDALRAR